MCEADQKSGDIRDENGNLVAKVTCTIGPVCSSEEVRRWANEDIHLVGRDVLRRDAQRIADHIAGMERRAKEAVEYAQNLIEHLYGDAIYGPDVIEKNLREIVSRITGEELKK